MIVLGCDPSMTNFGWALHDTQSSGKDRCLARGRFQTDPKRLDFIDRYLYLRDSLSDLCRKYRPDKCGCESPVFGALYSEGLYGLYLFTMEALKAYHVDVVLFSPGQGKAHARETIKRPATWKMLKPDMVEAAKTDTGGGQWNHNEADAYLIARLAARFWDFYEGRINESELTPVERKQFLLIHTFQRGARAGQSVKKGLLYRESDRFFLWSKTPSEI